MTFEAPIWLALAPLLALISISLIALGFRKRGQLLSQFAAARLLDRLTEKASLQRKLLKSAFIVAAIGAVGIALARPQFGLELSERNSRGLDIVFVLDSSKSMLATDLRPTRLERAKLAIFDLIDRLESDRVGLVAFAGQAFLQTPPTLDYSAFRESLNATDPSVLSRGGSDLGRAIEEASNAFPSENNVKVVVLLTDGEDLGGQALAAARTAAEESIQIFTIGIGTPEGEYLRVRNEAGIEEFVRDNDGQPVRSQLDESTLQQIAQFTGGSYSRLSGGSLETLYESVLATLPREERESELLEVPIERFQWLLAAASLFLVLEILIRSRRPGGGQVSLLLLGLLTFPPNYSEASTYNEAHHALSAGKFAEANVLYTEAMQETSDRNQQRDALYNMGHATYQIGRAAYDQGDAKAALEDIRSAEELFKSALELDPDDNAISEDLERTRQVREAIEKLLEQQQDQDQKSQDSDAQDGEPGDEQQDNQSQSGEQSEQPNSEEQNSDSEQSESQESGEQGEESEQQESQSGEQEQSETEPGEDASESEPSESEASEKAQSSQNQSGEEESSEESEQDTPAPSGEEQDGEDGEQTPVPEVEEIDEGSTGEEQGTGSAQSLQVEGMSLQEAQDLLDSLRGKEEILPFAKPAPGKGRPLKDW